ncbi:hypothetical protein ABB26_08600 [Stenotrophomonas humi]|uniref:DUF2878 domain-containing protein n=1 Tax=Stenotrophomonas humi TaxID=405444 RepID=A0A0R0CCK7_9GAMM|nr:DUF2878 domain-containing protein [Stenotrophomonas humi]KRG64234.1 hypothetical protein ABB26_08600 [Stenotrophomonas humi]
MRRPLLNLLGNQLVWLCAVAGAGRGWQWPALLASALYVVSQFASASQPRVELRLLLLALVCAWLVDGVAAASGRVDYAAAPLGWIPPPWIMALWAAFAMTLTSSMAFLRRNWLLPVTFGLLLAPLAYLSAARGFDAVRFAAPAWQGVLLLGVGWSVALTLLTLCARHWSRTNQQTLVGTSP